VVVNCGARRNRGCRTTFVASAALKGSRWLSSYAHLLPQSDELAAEAVAGAL
jgi:hypothetical protein